ncbi:Ephrin-A1, partial [Frankliniella fusca]
GSPLVGALLLLFLLTQAASKPTLSLEARLEARRLARSLRDWLQEDLQGPPQGQGQGQAGPGADELEALEADSSEQPSWEFVPAGSKRALSVLSRFTPFTSLGTSRRMGRFPVRSRGPSAPRDYISAETRGDFSDRPSGQPLRWGR